MGWAREKFAWGDDLPRSGDILILLGTFSLPLLTPLLRPYLLEPLDIIEKDRLSWELRLQGPINRRDGVALIGLFSVTTSIAAFAGPGDADPSDALAAVRRARPKLALVLGDLGGTAANARRNVAALSRLRIPVLFVAGGGDLFWGKNEAWLKCIDATQSGDITTNGLVWSYSLEKHVLSTPAVHEGLVFIADCGRKFHCLEAATGKPIWTHDIKGDAWASPLVADGKVYFGTRAGSFLIFAASREKRVLSSLDLVTPISATAAATPCSTTRLGPSQSSITRSPAVPPIGSSPRRTSKAAPAPTTSRTAAMSGRTGSPTMAGRPSTRAWSR
jgi:hypothetical protein